MTKASCFDFMSDISKCKRTNNTHSNNECFRIRLPSKCPPYFTCFNLFLKKSQQHEIKGQKTNTEEKWEQYGERKGEKVCQRKDQKTTQRTPSHSGRTGRDKADTAIPFVCDVHVAICINNDTFRVVKTRLRVSPICGA